MITSYQNFIGIDIGKFKNVAAVHNQKNTIKFDNNAAGWQQLFQNFSNILPNSFVTLENTGKYEVGLAHFLVDNNVAVHSDARALAQYGFERYSALSLFVPMSKEQTAFENEYIKESCQKTIDFFNSQINELNNAIQKIIDESIELQKRQKILTWCFLL